MLRGFNQTRAVSGVNVHGFFIWVPHASIYKVMILGGGRKMIGKEIRLERIINRKTGRAVIVPMDHGVSAGPIPGIANIRETMGQAADGGADAVVMHKGLVARGHRKSGPDLGLIVHLSGSTSLSPNPNAKTLVCTVEEAIKLGADAVSVHVNIGNGNENQMLTDLGNVAHSASQWGMPLLAMIYPRGEKIQDEYGAEVIKHAARLGAELGADLVKVSYTGNPDSFRKVVEGCHVPVVIAGGAKMGSDRAILEMVKGALEAGAAGTSIGRNVFQHQNPTKIVRALSMLVHENASVNAALKILQNGQGE